MIRLLFFILLLPSLSLAQEIEACGYYGSTARFSPDAICRSMGFESDEEASLKVDKIMDKVGLATNFIIMACPDMDNAFAANLEGDIGLLRYIIYDGDFLEMANKETQTKWAGVSILAHEIGHHLNGHTLDGQGSRPDKEIESDRFSGFVLQKLGATLEEAKAAMSLLSSEEASETHPGKADRLSAITEGWQNADALAPTYRKASLNADYTSVARQFFAKGYAVEGNSREDHVLRVAYYGKATEYKADYPEAYRNRAKYLNVLGEHKNALADANRAISLNKEFWLAYSEKATALLGLKEYDKAVFVYSIPIDFGETENPYDYAGRGWANYHAGNKVQARKDLQKALDLKPGWRSVEKKLKIVLH